jgi:hypothetical protein
MRQRGSGTPKIPPTSGRPPRRPRSRSQALSQLITPSLRHADGLGSGCANAAAIGQAFGGRPRRLRPACSKFHIVARATRCSGSPRLCVGADKPRTCPWKDDANGLNVAACAIDRFAVVNNLKLGKSLKRSLDRWGHSTLHKATHNHVFDSFDLTSLESDLQINPIKLR